MYALLKQMHTTYTYLFQPQQLSLNRCLGTTSTLLIFNDFSHFRKCFVSGLWPFLCLFDEDVILSFYCCLHPSNTILITNIFEGFRQCFVSQTFVGYYNKDMCSSRRANYCSIVTEKGAT